MPIVIEPYRVEHEVAVQDFNSRLQAGGAASDLVFFPFAEPRWLPRRQSDDLYQEYFVATENGVVRGGYALKQQLFSFADGSIRRVAYYHHPLSEGIVNKSYAAVGALLLKDAINRSTLLYCLGMGGYDRPLPKMLVRLNWAHCAIPLYVRVVHPYQFLRQMQALRVFPSRRLLMDLAAVTGLGWAGTKIVQDLRQIRAARLEPYNVETVEAFSDWVDPLWQKWRTAFVMTAVRDSSTLRLLYPPSETHLTRMRIHRNGNDIGWVVVGERRKDEKYGSLRVGSVVDCWASPDDARAVIHAASAALRDSGVDLIVSNQSHVDWGRAFRKSGFLTAASNFIFAASKNLATLLQPFEQQRSRIHFTRADGDGLPRNF